MCAAWRCLDDVILSIIQQCWSHLFDRQIQIVELFTVKGGIELGKNHSNSCCATLTE
uniref:Uncharacterized protein n=1 Tax=Lepeophtheirus salmonis TaxID=72036 RepID=A0A0K2TG28_LEPSM